MQIMQFGKKHVGETIGSMVRTDPDYARWLINIPAFRTQHPAAYALVRAAVVELLQAEAAADLAYGA
ncbi:MAG: hypothetical protein H7293_16675 [Candidatus Saccharibacteria bacterium]|nr:hypothetical protein [Rhodoferax sp.]